MTRRVVLSVTVTEYASNAGTDYEVRVNRGRQHPMPPARRAEVLHLLRIAPGLLDDDARVPEPITEHDRQVAAWASTVGRAVQPWEDLSETARDWWRGRYDQGQDQ